MIRKALLSNSLALLSVVPVMAGNIKNEKPNVLFVMCDQWRTQALGFTGEDPVITPCLDAFSKDAVVFRHAYSTRPICAPNRACLLSGQYPVNNGVYGNSVRMSTKTVTLGEATKQAGYQTAYIGKWHLDGPREGFVPADRRHGFDFWIMSQGHNPFGQKYFIQDKETPTIIKGAWEPDWVTNQAIGFMDKQTDKPFCMVVSYGPPHTGGGPGFEDRWQPGKRTKGQIKYGYGYAAPKEFEAMYPDPEHMERRPNVKPVGEEKDPSWETLPGYFGAITSIDRNFGRLVDHLKKTGKYENTIIVFTSDHGEMLGSQGRMTKGVWYEESVGIPFLIAYPAKVKANVSDKLINSIDFMPTILNLAGLKAPESVDGTSYSNFLLDGKEKGLPQEVFLSFDQGSFGERDRSWRAVRTLKYLFCLAKKERFEKTDPLQDGMVLYDMENDPYQMKPIFRGMGHDQVIDNLMNKLVDHLKKTNDSFVELQWKTNSDPKKNWNDALDKSIIPGDYKINSEE